MFGRTARCSTKQSAAASATCSNAPGPSNRCVAPEMTLSLNRQVISSDAARLRSKSSSSAPPTSSSVGHRTWTNAGPTRSGRPPRETSAQIKGASSTAATNAAAAPVLEPKKPNLSPAAKGCAPTQRVAVARWVARKPMSKCRCPTAASRRSSAAVAGQTGVCPVQLTGARGRRIDCADCGARSRCLGRK